MIGEAVWVAIVTALGGAYAVTLTVLVPVLVSTRKHVRAAASDAAATKAEVKNDHEKNLREEADERHEENSQKLDLIGVRLEQLHERVDGLTKGYHANKARIENLEHTQPRSRLTTKDRGKHRKEPP